jgi:SecD/SecF fusion protein
LLPENFSREHQIVCDMFKNDQGYFNYYIIKKPVNKTSTFSAHSIESCEINEQDAQPNLLIKTNENNDPTWEVFTGNNVQKQIAILINNAVIFAPMINEKITGNEFSISGNFNLEEAKEAASLINMGHIPYPLEILKQEKISE